MRKILICVTQVNIGAAELLDISLYFDLKKQGYDVDMISIYSKQYSYVKNGKKDMDLSFVQFLGLSTDSNSFDRLSCFVKYLFFIKKNNYCAILTSSSATSFFTAMAGIFVHFLHIVGIHQVYDKKYNNSYREKLMPYIFFKKNTLFYAVSRHAKYAWSKYAKIDPFRIKTIYNNVDVFLNNSLPIEKLKINDKSKIIINVGRVCTQKNQLLLIESLKNYLIKENIFLIFAGDVDYRVPGTVEMCKKIKTLIDLYNLHGNILFLGYRNDVADLIKGADILVHTANREAFGLALVEAMLVGTPIISTNVEAIPEILSGTSYTTIPPGDDIKLRQAIFTYFSMSNRDKSFLVNSGLVRAKFFTDRDERAVRVASLIDKFNNK